MDPSQFTLKNVVSKHFKDSEMPDNDAAAQVESVDICYGIVDGNY